jgi:hypothetical protein
VGSRTVVGALSTALLGLASAAQAAPVRAQPDRGVDVPVYGPVLGDIYRPQIACLPDQCLRVWTDTRIGEWHSWAQRIGRDGTALDPASFLITRGATSLNAGLVADGNGYLIAQAGEGKFEIVRIDAGGKLTSVASFPVAPGSEPVREARLARGANGFLLVWTQALGASTGPVFAARLDGEGKPVGTAMEVATGPVFGVSADVAWTGAHYVVIWRSNMSPSSATVVGTRVSGTGQRLDAEPYFVTALVETSHRPRLVWSGKDLLLIAGGDRGMGASTPDVVLLDADGKNARKVALPKVQYTFSPTGGSASWNGTHFVVTWIEGMSGRETVAARIAPDGTVLDRPPLLLSTGSFPDDASEPAVASLAGGDSLVVFGQRGTWRNRLMTGVVRADGTVVKGAVAGVAANRQRLLAAARSGKTTLVLFADDRDGEEAASLRAVRIGDDGTPMDAVGLMLAPTVRKLEKAAVTGSAGGFVVLWGEEDAQLQRRLRALRIPVTGPPAAPAAELATGFEAFNQFTIASGDAGHLVVRHTRLMYPGQIVLQRLDADLKPQGPPVMMLSTGSEPGLAALAVGDAYLVAWLQPNNGTPLSIIRLAADGTLTPGPAGHQVAVAQGPMIEGAGKWLSLTGEGGKLLLLWEEGAVPLDADGKPMGMPAMFREPGRSLGPPAWDGRFFTSAGFGRRTDSDRLIVRQMSASGLFEPEQTLTRMPMLGLTAPTVVGLGEGRSLVVFGRMVEDREFGIARVRYLLLDPDASGGGGGGDGSASGGVDGGVVDAAAPANAGDAARDAAAGGLVDAGDAGDSGAGDGAGDAGPADEGGACDCRLDGAARPRFPGLAVVVVFLWLACRLRCRRAGTVLSHRLTVRRRPR